ncbi:histidine--tRNA ligase [Patescibacteria group bacterium]|nr:histidine--tRNA ligase [Patescibacteria group bacterium]
MKLSTNPPKGTYDFTPQEFRIRKYIFDTWRSVLLSFGYEEYLTPIVESAEIYKAKSGEDVGGKELMSFKDRAERELAIRPEMTPSVTRMVCKNYEELKKPIRYFSIANFFRNEKPQRGRNREFWQLNYDIFGEDSVLSDVEILQIALDTMLKFNAPRESFVLYINSRKIIDFVLQKAEISSPIEVVRILDKYEKLSSEDFEISLKKLELSEKQIKILKDYISCNNEKELLEKFEDIKDLEEYKNITTILSTLTNLGYADYISYNPKIIRGFDYYDGMIFEVFDRNKENPRAMFGGGRYNGLSQIFGVKNFSAVGAAFGDETTKLFLEGWNLTSEILKNTKEEVYYFPILDESMSTEVLSLAQKLRLEGKNVITSYDIQSLKKSLDVANKREYSSVIIYGTFEKQEKIYKLKNMLDGVELKIDYQV